VLAEVKRASPSKGDIALGIVAPEQALRYAHGGAAAISVLTEPTWFKGTLDDMRGVADALAPLIDRPAVLRKVKCACQPIAIQNLNHIRAIFWSFFHVILFCSLIHFVRVGGKVWWWWVWWWW
jgi:hypothetical protein